MNYPITPAIRVLREKKIEFEPHVFEYVEKGGTKHSSEVLGVDEHAVVKTLVFETNEKKPLIVLMHGDFQVSTKTLARHLNVKTITPVAPEKASKLSGYLVGGTSPFGAKTKMPIYAEKTIFDLQRIYINGGKRGFLIAIDPQILHDVLNVTEVEVKQEKDAD
ncbi:MAG TPA: Cys-tRNA(Pro) deacylase [Pyrinomonadaceae bacterium]|jgi:Cys-tRNA(Pro) deacylase